MTALIIAGVIAWLFWPSKSRWHPFGGIYSFDKRTGRLKIAVTLPTTKSKRRTAARKGKR